MADTNYTLHKPGSFIDYLSTKKRHHMFQLFLTDFPEHSFAKVLDVGVTADIKATSSNYFEKLCSHKEKIIALSNQDASFLEKEYPGLTYKLGDAKALPFQNDSIDVVFSSAVIEHIGSNSQQKQMISECFRVAKKGVFITTPNRWHPVDAHTLLPFLHWLPKKLHRFILKLIGLNFYAHEENLNLLDANALINFCKELNIRNFVIKRIKTFGLTSNLLLIIKKT